MVGADDPPAALKRPPQPRPGRVDGSCLVLDFDGTILDTEQPVYQSWSELWEEHGVALSRSRWQAIIGTTDVFDPWVELQQVTGATLDPALQDRRRARQVELQAGYDARPGVLTWLDAAEDMGLPVAIASSSPTAWVSDHLGRLGLAPRFPVLVCCDDVVPPKPDPTSYREACRRLGAFPRWSVAVEDSPHGVAAARAAGLFTVAVPHGLTLDLDLSGADLVAPSLTEVSLADTLSQARRRPR